LGVNLERIKRDIEAIAMFNATPGNGVTRFSYSQQDKQARDYLMSEIKKLGLKTEIDAVGNIRARLEGSNVDGRAVMIGSHIDSVRNGGKFDGIVGVIGALEVIRVIKEQGIKTKSPIELVIFAEEEGSNFGSTLVGSKFMVGRYTVDDLKRLKSSDGKTAYQVIKEFGLDIDDYSGAGFKPGEIKCMIELHIEQSVVLDNANLSIGIVEAIAGMKTLRIVFRGVANHAGATPMGLRQDPMAAAGEAIVLIEKLAKEKAYPSTVATVGRISCLPNVPNVIPGAVAFSVDVRDVKPEGIDIVVSELEKEIKLIAKTRGLDYEFEMIGQSEPVILSADVVQAIEDSVKEKGYSYMRMNSGAVHDACMLADIVPVGMIFVPSINGRSHVPEEYTRYEDIEKGCDVLLGTVIKMAE
jgi:allantoate deiminase